MDFRGADIGNVLKFFAMATNWQIVPDAGLTGPVTIISPKALTIQQAFQVLQSTLEVRGFAAQLEKRGETTILKIVPLDRAVQSTALVRNAKLAGTDDFGNQVITQVIMIDNVDAATLARELTPLINKGASLVGSAGTNALVVTDTAANVDRIARLVKDLDNTASARQIQLFPLKHTDANDIVSAINNLFRQVYTRGRTSRQQGQPGQPQPGQPGGDTGGGAAAAGDDRGAVVAVADTRTNSVLVVASDDNMTRVADVIKKLDDPEAAAMQTKIVKMKYASAQDVADVINSVLSNSLPTRATSSGASFQSRVFGGGFFGGFGGGSSNQSTTSTDPFAKVVADARTNSLVITAIDERMTKIDELVKQLDVEVPAETTTFVVPLRNAQANDLAYILGQAFGTSSSNSSYNPYGGYYSFFGNSRSSSSQRTSINRRQTSTSSRAAAIAASRAASIASSRASGTSPVVDANGVHGTMTPSGFVADTNTTDTANDDDAPKSRQGFFNQFYGGYGRNSMQTTPQYGRGSTGNYVNLLQLRNNVSVVAEPGSNSLIVTTTPDNIQAIKDIIDQIDTMPRQVMIEVIIAEASLDSTNKLGFQFDFKGVGRLFGSGYSQSGSSNFPLGANGNTSANIATPENPGLNYGVQAISGNYNALIQALSTDNKVRILSTPKVFTSNNQEATIDVTTNIPYVTSSYTGGLNIGSSVNYDFLPVGITLDVTPRITQDGVVTIDVVSTASELLGFDTLTASVSSSGTPTTLQAPRTSERTTDTSITAHNGEIVALGGLMRDTKTVNANKVPLLGDIPILGSLFRSSTTTTSKTELMIFMIPHVVDGTKSNAAVVHDQAEHIRKVIPELNKKIEGAKESSTTLDTPPIPKTTDKTTGASH